MAFEMIDRVPACRFTAMMSPTATRSPSSVQDRGSSFSALPMTRSTSGIAANTSGSICAAQPVTTMRASGRSRLMRRMVWRACRTASAVTAQVFTTTASSSPAWRRAPDHFRFGDVEPAAEGDDVEAHATPALSNNAGSNLPANSNSTGPVIST